MSQYAVLIYQDEAAFASRAEELGPQLYADHVTFGEQNDKAIAGGQALQGSETATAIRGDNAGGFIVTDGPFVETKEVLGGFYLIEAADLDEAIAIAKQVPAPLGGVEVRPVRVFD
jgi:hypothetical protein